MDSKIVIIGAGASGIAAAVKLIDCGFKNVTILEAEDRFGGRINTINFGQNVVDMGAQWCHGEKDNVVYELASKYGLLASSDLKYVDFISVRSNKEIIDQGVTKKLLKVISNYLENVNDEFKNSNLSMGELLTKNFFNTLENEEYSDIDKTIASEFFEFYKKLENSIEGSDNLFDVSANGYLEYKDCPGDKNLNWKDKGYISFLNLLMGRTNTEGLGKLQDKILFNRKVKKIDYSESQVNVILEDDQRIIADHVICTISLGVLKENFDKLFAPKLPEAKISAINNLGFGTVNKIYLEFSKKFWPDMCTGYALLWTENDLVEIRKRGDNWLEDVFGFFTVDYQENILCGWICGEASRRMESASDNDVLQGCIYLLRKFLTLDVPEPINFKRSKWNSNPNFKGSYSFRSMKTHEANTSAQELGAFIMGSKGEPLLQFAGEATSSTHYSTVHGAVESGWREANLLAEHYNRNNIYDVLILGAGLAGLGAAFVLKKSNLNYKILEAQNYVGGRILTRRLKNYINVNDNDSEISIDTGAQWLHGEQNVLYKLAQKYDLIDSILSEEALGEYRFQNEKNIFDEFFRLKIDFVIGKILKECENFVNSKIYPKSVEDFLETKFAEYVKTFGETDERTRAMQLLDWHYRFQVIDNSCLFLSDLSAKSWGLYAFNGESCQAHINIKTGFSSLIENILSKELFLTNKILLNQQIYEINTVNELENQHILVKTIDGNNFYAKNVLVTFSIGVLKKLKATLFKPNLPAEINCAIDCMGMESINKIFLQFRENWWNEAKGIQFIFADRNYNGKNWTRYLSGFDVMHPGPKNTLLGWVGGQGASEMEKLTDKEIVEDCVKTLKQFTTIDVPSPIRYYCTRWGNNEFVRGGYSFINTKDDEYTENARIKLKKNITYDMIGDKLEIALENENCNSKNNHQKVQILFAGEACHENFFSTAHGAFLSGIEQCTKILKNFK